MKIEDYPAQGRLSDAGEAYVAETLKRGEGVAHENVAYGDDVYQQVAVFTPEAGQANGTILMMMHGGGWTNGYKEVMAFQAPPLTAAGIVVVSVGYRLAPANVFPTGYEDTLQGIAWVYNNAARYGGDPERLFVSGHSAGGHYAALMAVTRDWQEDLGLPENVIRGWLPISGVYDFGEGSGLSMRPRFLGPENTGSEVAASPIHQIDGTPPPVFMTHGEEDFPHLCTQAEAMEAALAKIGCDVERDVFPGRNHFTAHLAAGEIDGPWVGRALKWMAAH